MTHATPYSSIFPSTLFHPQGAQLKLCKSEKDYRQTEYALNVLGWIPVISYYTGAARVICHTADLLLNSIRKVYILAHSKVLYPDNPQAFQAENYAINVLLMHNCGNIVRGVLEMATSVSILFKLLFIIYDGENFRMTYPEEAVMKAKSEDADITSHQARLGMYVQYLNSN